MTTVLDFFGNPLKVGDPIMFAKKGDDSLHEGYVNSIHSVNPWITVKRKSTGRVSVNWRHGSEVINVKPLIESNPEWFI